MGMSAPGNTGRNRPGECAEIICPDHKPHCQGGYNGGYRVECTNNNHCKGFNEKEKQICHETKCFECMKHEHCDHLVQCVNRKCGCTSNSHCPGERPTCEDGKCVNKENPHQKIEAGKTCFSKDLAYLRTAKECEEAAKTFDIPYGGHFSGDTNPSCVYRESEKKIYFNRNSRARCLKDNCKTKMDSNHAAICKDKGPMFEHATPTDKKCKNYYSWRRCDRGCPCNSGVDEYCDRGEGSGERGVCMRVIDCEFVDFTLNGYIGSEEEAIKSGFDYTDKEGAIAKCRQTNGCRGVFLKMPEGLWVLSSGGKPAARYKGEGSIAVPMSCLDGCTIAHIGSSRNKHDHVRSVWIDTNRYKCPSTVDKSNWIGGDKHDYVFTVYHPFKNRVNVYGTNTPNGWLGFQLRFRCCPK